MFKNYKRIWSNPFYVKRKAHQRPNCGQLLSSLTVRKTVNSNSPEAQYFDFSSGEFRVKGDMMFVYDIFHCESCGKEFSIGEMKRFERGALRSYDFEQREKALLSYDKFADGKAKKGSKMLLITIAILAAMAITFAVLIATGTIKESHVRTEMTGASLYYVYIKKHYCLNCGSKVNTSYTSEIINYYSPEAKDHDFTIGDGGKYHGDMEFRTIIFHCPNCGADFTIKEMKEFEDGIK